MKKRSRIDSTNPKIGKDSLEIQSEMITKLSNFARLLKVGVRMSEDISNISFFDNGKVVIYNGSAFLIDESFFVSTPEDSFCRFDDFNHLISKLPEKTKISIETKDNQLLISTVGERTSSGIPLNREQSISMNIAKEAIDKVKKMKWIKAVDDLVTGLSLCSLSTAFDISNPELSCILFNKDEILSTDHYRMSLYQLDNLKLGAKILVPVVDMKTIISFATIEEITWDDRWLFMRLKNNMLAGILLASEVDKFPIDTIKKSIESGEKGLNKKDGIELPKDNTIQGINYCAPLAQEEDQEKQLELSIDEDNPDELLIRSASERGWVTYALPIKNETKKAFSTSISSRFLTEALAHEPTIWKVKNKDLLIMKTKDGKFKHLVSTFPKE